MIDKAKQFILESNIKYDISDYLAPLLVKFTEYISIHPETIQIHIPTGYMNCAVTIDNHFIADTNDSSNWNTLKFPLPTPKYRWNIKSIDNKTVILIDNE